MKRVLSNKWSIMVFVLPTLLFFTYIVTIPIIKTLWYSTLNEIPAIVKDNSKFIGLGNFIELFTPAKRNAFPGAVVNGLLYALVSCGIQLPFSLLIALLIARGVKGENFFRNVFFIPVLVSSVVVSMLWQRIYKDILPAALQLLNIAEPKNGFLANKDTKIWAVFIPSLWQYVGYHMLLMYGALRSIPEDILEAATVDGASGPRMAWSIQLPMIKPMLKVCFSFSLIGSFKLFDTPWVLLGRDAKDLPALYMYVTMFTGHRYSLASSAAAFIIIECLVGTVLLNIIFRENDGRDLTSRRRLKIG